MKMLFALGVMFCCTGCASMLLGLKSYETKESRTEFITGYDFGIGVNGVDTVKNERGIKPNDNEKKQRDKSQD